MKERSNTKQTDFDRIKLPFRENFLEHTSHSNDFSPVWVLLCLIKLPKNQGIVCN